jgi:IclR family transcriptional regulator, KDG regulon repressor
MMMLPEQPAGRARATSLDKALALCEALSQAPRGSTVSELAKLVALPPPTVHRLLAVLKRRGYVRQDEETSRYGLTLKMLDLSFRWLGRSEVRLHAYPVVREHVLRTAARAFVAVPGSGEVTYVWSAGPDEVAMHTA